jgi:rubrerythrin
LRQILEELSPEKVDEIDDLVDARNEILEEFEKITKD